MYANIRHTSEITLDVREQFADLVYKQSRGVVAHNLAFKILNSKEEIDISQGELDVISSILELCTPQFQDSFNHNVENNE